MYVTRGMDGGEGVGGGHPKCIQMPTGGEKYHASCECTYLSLCFCLMVPCFICRNLTIPSFKNGVFLRNGYFSPMRSTSVVMKKPFFYFKLLFQTKVSQSGFHFNQIES